MNTISFRDAKLSFVEFKDCNLKHADFQGANMFGFTIDEDIPVIEDIDLKVKKYINNGRNLKGSSNPNAILSYANIVYSLIENTSEQHKVYLLDMFGLETLASLIYAKSRTRDGLVPYFNKSWVETIAYIHKSAQDYHPDSSV